MGIDLTRPAQWNAKLVLRLAGRDLVVGLGIDVGIDPHRDIGDATLAGRDRGQELKLRLGFDVDAEDALIDRKRELARSLADAGKHDLVRRNAGEPRTLELALRHNVGAGAKARECLDHGLIRVRLHGVADEGGHAREHLQRR